MIGAEGPFRAKGDCMYKLYLFAASATIEVKLDPSPDHMRVHTLRWPTCAVIYCFKPDVKYRCKEPGGKGQAVNAKDLCH
jgi:hypothetical protein